MTQWVQTFVDPTSVQLARDLIVSAGGKLAYRNRDGKQYIKVSHPTDWNTKRVRLTLDEHLANLILTSASPYESTWRINPDVTS